MRGEITRPLSTGDAEQAEAVCALSREKNVSQSVGIPIDTWAHKPSVLRSHPSDIKGRRVRLRSAGTQSKSTMAPKQVRVQARNRRWNADSAITLGAT